MPVNLKKELSNNIRPTTAQASTALDKPKEPIVLIADDDETLLTALGIRLEQLGMVVMKATNGQLAIDLASQTKPELLILDINMPLGDGFSIVKKMDDVPGLMDIPVIYITGADGGHELDMTSERLGAMAILRKPLEIDQLINHISLMLPVPSRTV